MFSMLFGSGKKKSSSDENLSIPPIPSARPDDFVVVDRPIAQPSNIYPTIPAGAPMRPAPQPPFHYLQGVPFRLCKELEMNANKDTFSIQIGDILAFAARKLKMEDFQYDFSLEKSVLRECGNS